MAGYGNNEPLAMDYFGGAMAASGSHKVVYHESHDEAGNSSYEVDGRRIESHRTIVSAVNSAPLTGQTRRYGEGRCRFACGMTMMSAGTPMFFMGEEIGAQKQYRYRDFLDNREDLFGERKGEGKLLFKFYQDVIRLRRNHSGLRSHKIDVVYLHNEHRIIAFRRWDEKEDFLIVGSLNNLPFADGYVMENDRIPDGSWQEIFNSDSEVYGGDGIANYDVKVTSKLGKIGIVIPANGFVVLQKVLRG